MAVKVTSNTGGSVCFVYLLYISLYFGQGDLWGWGCGVWLGESVWPVGITGREKPLC